MTNTTTTTTTTTIQCVWLVRYGLTEHALIEGGVQTVSFLLFDFFFLLHRLKIELLKLSPSQNKRLNN